MNQPVSSFEEVFPKVRFAHNQRTWDAVVVEAQVMVMVDESRSDYFEVEYISYDEWYAERARLGGQIEYEELNPKPEQS